MAVEITSRDTMDPTYVVGDLAGVVNHMNIAAASGKKFIVMEETSGANVALETGNITRMREKDDVDAYIGRN